jgi:hypothetical protein
MQITSVHILLLNLVAGLCVWFVGDNWWDYLLGLGIYLAAYTIGYARGNNDGNKEDPKSKN